jgi:hypothetical protein
MSIRAIGSSETNWNFEEELTSTYYILPLITILTRGPFHSVAGHTTVNESRTQTCMHDCRTPPAWKVSSLRQLRWLGGLDGLLRSDSETFARMSQPQGIRVAYAAMKVHRVRELTSNSRSSVAVQCSAHLAPGIKIRSRYSPPPSLPSLPPTLPPSLPP